jgi:hypothetical protein
MCFFKDYELYNVPKQACLQWNIKQRVSISLLASTKFVIYHGGYRDIVNNI